MYMLVFVTLVVSMIGVYTQVFTQQAIRQYAQQAGVAQTLIGWHSTAGALAYYMVSKTSPVAGCEMTNEAGFGLAAAPVAPCIDSLTGANVYVAALGDAGANPSNAPLCSTTTTAPCWTYLPNGYTKVPYTFYSIVYQVAGVPTLDYVLTFVPPSSKIGNDYAGRGGTCLPGVIPAGPACPPTQRQISLSLSGLYAQLARTNYSLVSYGTVNASSQLVTAPIQKSATDTSPFIYQVPSYVPAGSIGLITQFVPCTIC